ncbi:MAG: NADH-quinone oxidoreductase subunit N [Gammaproteobacteria bacterium]|nr:NADH-quinone oxidoreductase subunit N [Gammaproteobacteria bacterium]
MNGVIYGLSQLAILLSMILLLKRFSTFSVLEVLGNGLFTIDLLTIMSSLMILLFGFISFYNARQELVQFNLPYGEYYALCLFSLVGMLVLSSASHFLTAYLAIELLSFPLYILVAYHRISVRGTEAALKYFVTGALASGFFLYGMSLIYGAAHSLLFVDLVHVTPSPMFVIGIIFVLAGLAFKLGLAPFHLWLPDVYEGAPLSVVTFLSGAPKIAVFVLLIRLVEHGFNAVFASHEHLFILLGLLSMMLGNFFALTQKKIRRLFAYSSVAQMGFIVIALAGGNNFADSSAYFYLLTYAGVSVGFFSILTLLQTQGVVIDEVKDLAGIGRRYPVIGCMLMLLIFSMAGIPPLVGFMGKLFVLLTLIDGHSVQIAALVVFLSIVGLYYYLNVVKIMYFDKLSSILLTLRPIPPRSLFFITSIAFFSLLLGICPSPLYELCCLI